ncbi:uncharacterized protein LOC132796039 [Drosophila nasuta]|uniref:uncharacterized protein LOC132796039 n=1 Tax=Drosophila nasuta TaxID=42062 RepID=UPI00295F299B|nr:uncharacterized protein LOC132796039 [Drosophila nasuta]
MTKPLQVNKNRCIIGNYGLMRKISVLRIAEQIHSQRKNSVVNNPIKDLYEFHDFHIDCETIPQNDFNIDYECEITPRMNMEFPLWTNLSTEIKKTPFKKRSLRKLLDNECVNQISIQQLKDRLSSPHGIKPEKRGRIIKAKELCDPSYKSREKLNAKLILHNNNRPKKKENECNPSFISNLQIVPIEDLLPQLALYLPHPRFVKRIEFDSRLFDINFMANSTQKLRRFQQILHSFYFVVFIGFTYIILATTTEIIQYVDNRLRSVTSFFFSLP